jgi:hypothetical protein
LPVSELKIESYPYPSFQSCLNIAAGDTSETDRPNNTRKNGIGLMATDDINLIAPGKFIDKIVGDDYLNPGFTGVVFKHVHKYFFNTERKIFTAGEPIAT